jgi:hypothetical protein
MQSHIHPIFALIYSYGRTLGLPVYGALIALLWQRRLIKRSHFFLGFLAAAFFSVMTTEKAPLALLIATAALAVYLSEGCPMNPRVLRVAVVVFFTFLVVPALFYPLLQGKGGSEGASVLVENLIRRVTWVPSWVAACYFDAFGNYFPFLGAGGNRVLAAISGEPYRFAPSMMYAFYVEGAKFNEGGTMNGAFFAAFYAQWGMSGMIVGAIVAGVAAGAVQLFFESRRQDLATNGVKAMVLMGSVQLLSSDFYTVSFSRGFLSLPVAFWLLEKLFRQRSAEGQKPQRAPLETVTSKTVPVRPKA